LVVINVLLPDPLPRGVVAVGVGIVAADVVGGESEVVVGIGLAVGQQDRVLQANRF
jgi:hypothetical protein